MRQYHWKTVVAVFCVIHLVVLGPIGVYVYGWWQAWNKLYDIEWISSGNPVDGKETAERALRVPLDIHDPCILLERCGDTDSIPYLIGALKWQSRLPNQSAVADCTRFHPLEALRKITGVDAGLNYEDWRDWYQKFKQKGKP